ncbi:phage tail-collar fiber domain-containing protein [Oscillibacter ruminantium]|uniref:phage tail-collar fiber domain-containing protein n=1 Tax=Oscillibacter ruminantium TaxID=1263547 RepID=UPI0006870237|nr:phage tail protein [Oscillibacter ruminantium]
MASFPTMTVTNAGQAVLTKGLSGKTLSFTKIVLGDGQLNGQSISALTALISQKAVCNVTRKSITGGAYQVGGLLLPENITTGFYWREIGLIVIDPDTSAEVLYAYANAGTATDYIDPNTTDTRFEKNIYVNTKITSASNVTIEIPSSDTYAMAVHASQHAAGGNDPITPEAIGAAKVNHTHTAQDVSADPSGAAAAVQANLDAHAGNTTAHLTAAERTAWNGKANTVTLTCTVPVAWTASGDFFYQNVSVPGMLASDNPTPGILFGGDNAANKLYDEAFGKVLHITTYDNLIQVWCTEAPTVALPLQFKVVR